MLNFFLCSIILDLKNRQPGPTGPSPEAAKQPQHLGWPVRAVREREAKPEAKEAESRMARKDNPRKAGTA